MKKITRSQLNTWLDSISKQAKLVAPVESNENLVYRQIGSVDEIAWGFQKTIIPPKNWYFPMTESILNIEQGKTTSITQPPTPERSVVFGVRPCDARSVLAFDALFLKKSPVDPQYARHRDALTMIGFSCPKMWDTCFCTAVGGAPNSKDGLDILLTEIEGGFALEVVTEKGRELIAGLDLEDVEITLEEPQVHSSLPQLRNSKEWITLLMMYIGSN